MLLDRTANVCHRHGFEIRCVSYPSDPDPSTSLRACECFEFLLSGGVLVGGKRPREVSPSRVCVEVDNIAIEFWPFSGRNRLKSPELALCVYLAYQRLPAQEVVGHGDKEHYAGDFGKSPYVELAHSVKTNLGVRPFRH